MKWLDQTMAVKGVSISRLHLTRRPDYRLSEPGTLHYTQHTLWPEDDGRLPETFHLNPLFCTVEDFHPNINLSCVFIERHTLRLLKVVSEEPINCKT